VKLTVRMFGALAELAGVDRDVVDVPDGATAAEVIDAMGTRHRQAAGILPRLRVAVNLEVVPAERRIAPDDEVALLPPVAGGGAAILVGLREAPSVGEALDVVAGPDAGATVAFVGTVRGDRGRVERLEYSAYTEMAERVLGDVALEAAEKWNLHGVAILHGVGELAVGRRTVVVACAAGHREEAFDACRYVIDEVKRRAPIWKKEVGPRRRRWVGLE
jgi:molybdopterin synthase catalytic subunit/molybdopterin converting factor small subunit